MLQISARCHNYTLAKKSAGGSNFDLDIRLETGKTSQRPDPQFLDRFAAVLDPSLQAAIFGVHYQDEQLVMGSNLDS